MSIPAFPKPKLMQQVVSFDQEDGMSLRDYFAAKAMQGFAACDAQWPTAEAVAVNAYQWADAMLKAREQ